MTGALVDTAEVSVSIEDDGWLSALPNPAATVERAVEAALGTACPGLPGGGVAIVLTDDAQIQALNRRWRGIDAATNVLSFPATATKPGDMPRPDFPGGPLELGDIVIARETCLREAATASKPLNDHVTHLAVHGALHLLGYDHLEDNMALTMERLETVVLQQLGVPDPYG